MRFKNDEPDETIDAILAAALIGLVVAFLFVLG